MAISGWKTSFLVGAVFLLGLADMIRHEASGQPTHFQLPMSRTGNDATVLIPGTANPNIGGVRLEPGDEIAVVSSSGLLVGHTIWNGASAGITIWGDDDQTPELDGLNKDEPFTFILWDKSDNRLYSSVKVTFDPAFQTRMSYRPDAIFILTSLSAGDYELGMVTIEDRLLSPGAPPVLIDLNKALFADGKRVRITYLARSSNEHVASVKIDQSQLWVSPIAEGSARITVIVIDEEGASRATSFEMTVTTRAEIPVTFKIHPNYPNPLKTSTRIRSICRK